MNPRPSLREALARADAEPDEKADARGIGLAIAIALEEAEKPPPAPERYTPNAEEERERVLDAALADAIETVSRHRMRLGRRVCSRPDGTVTRKIYELLRGMAGPEGGADGDPSFQ